MFIAGAARCWRAGVARCLRQVTTPGLSKNQPLYLHSTTHTYARVASTPQTLAVANIPVRPPLSCCSSAGGPHPGLPCAAAISSIEQWQLSNSKYTISKLATRYATDNPAEGTWATHSCRPASAASQAAAGVARCGHYQLTPEVQLSAAWLAQADAVKANAIKAGAVEASALKASAGTASAVLRSYKSSPRGLTGSPSPSACSQ